MSGSPMESIGSPTESTGLRGDHQGLGLWRTGAWRTLVRGNCCRLLVAALLGGIWGTLLARVLSEVWPLGSAGLSWSPCWLWSPLPAILLGLGGAFCALLFCLPDGVYPRRESTGLWQERPMPRRWAPVILLWPLSLGILYLVQPLAAPLWGIGVLIAGLGGVWWLQADGLPSRGTIRRALETSGVPGSASLEQGARPVELAWNAVAFLLPLALYVGTLAPSVLPGDSGEFQFVAPMLGIPHPTGYPLYLLLGKLISLVPLHSVAYRLNMLSAVAAAGTVWVVYRCGRALGMRRVAAFLGAGLLAVSETFWSQATIAEKYTLNTFFVALTLWLGLQWRREYLAAGHSGRRVWKLALRWAFFYGLSLTHHRTMFLLAPVYAYLALSTGCRLSAMWSASAAQELTALTLSRRTLDRRSLWRFVFRLARIAGLVLAPLLLYLLLPVFSARRPPYAYVRLDSARAFWDLVLARTYQGALFRGGWTALPGRLTECARLLSRQFGWLGWMGAAAGWFVLVRRQKNVAWVLLAGIAAQVLFALNYYVPNTALYYLPAYVWLVVCIACAVDAVLVMLEPPDLTTESEQKARSGRFQRLLLWTRPAWPHLTLALVLFACIWPMVLLTTRLPGMDRRRAYSRLAFDHAYGQVAAGSVEPGALVVSDWLPATVLWYMQWVEGWMPTVQVAVVDPLEGGWAGLIDGALAGDRPAYLARPLMAAGDRHSLTSAGPLVRVLDAPMSELPGTSLRMFYPAASEQSAYGGDVRALGAEWIATGPGAEGTVYAPSDGVIQGGSTLHVTVYWQALRPPAGDYAVTLRLVDVSGGHSWLERKNRHPVGGTYPTSRWQAEEVVGDYYELALPPHLPTGEYELRGFMAVPGDVALAAPRETVLARFLLRKPLRWPNPVLGTAVRKRFDGELLLVGYDAPGKLAPGETVSIALQWLVCSRTVPRGADVRFRPRLVGVSRDGTERSLMPYTASSSESSVSEESAKHGDWQPGALVVDVYEVSVPRDLAYLKVQSAHGRARYRLPLRVVSEPPSGTNFGNVIRLNGHSYQAKSTKPGATVHLVLEWEAVRAMDEAYKVFVHVLGPNGLPIAQQDNEPVNGTYSTIRWQPGERVSDPYAIRLPDDLPPGEYPVEVGLYRISDLSRLPVLGADQSLLDDKVFLSPLTVK